MNDTRGTMHSASEMPKCRIRPRIGGFGEGQSRKLLKKSLTIIYHTLKNNWIFEDFPNGVLAQPAA